MKSRTFLISAILLCASFVGNVSAQDNNDKKDAPAPDRMEMMVKGMQNKLMLDDATAEKFSSVYKEYLQALKDCCKKNCCKKDMKKGSLSDSEIIANIKSGFETEKKMTETKEKYFNKMKSFLNAKQLETIFGRGGKCPGCPNGKNLRGQFNRNRGFFNGPNGGLRRNCPNGPKAGCPNGPAACPKGTNICPNGPKACPNATQPSTVATKM